MYLLTKHFAGGTHFSCGKLFLFPQGSKDIASVLVPVEESSTSPSKLFSLPKILTYFLAVFVVDDCCVLVDFSWKRETHIHYYV
jgi:hypothetical protein